MSKEIINFTVKKPFCKFLVIDFIELDFDSRNKIMEIISDLYNDYDTFLYRNMTVFVYYEDLDIDIKSIFTAINDDFNTEIKIFESGKVDSVSVIQLLCDAYIDNCKHYKYVNNCSLVLELVRKQAELLKSLRPYILNKVNSDSSLQDVINGMIEHNLNVTKTSEHVYMHRNTINNKLDVIRKETGLNVQDFKDAIALYILLKIK